MKPLGICIRYFNFNYGGMLQNYALLKVLKNMGINYEIIRYKPKKNILFAVKSLPRLLNTVLLRDKYEALQKKVNLFLHSDFAKNERIRAKAFDNFAKKHFIPLSPVFENFEHLQNAANNYSAVMSGSDQLWSPAGLPTNFYNLQFVPNAILKISYASSFGVSKIPFYQRKRTVKFLSRIEHISVRESNGQKIIEELTRREVPVVADPVLLLSKSDWDKEIPQENHQPPYIFAYFLGTNKEHRKQIAKLQKHTNLKVIALRHIDRYVSSDENFGDYAPYDINPEQFLNLIRGAEFICTDSFHGMCFSILNHKKFLVFNRYSQNAPASKNSRIDSLCSALECSDRRFSADVIGEIQREIDYGKIDENLLRIRKFSFDYLKKLPFSMEKK